MRRTLSIAAAVAALAPVWAAGPAGGATLVERSLPAASQPGSRARDYTVAVPDDLDPDAAVAGGHGAARLPADRAAT